GLVAAAVRVQDGAARAVTIRNVPSFAADLDAVVKLDGPGATGHREARYDLAFGGNFYAILPLADFGIPFERADQQRILDTGLAVGAGGTERRRRVPPHAPATPGCHHVQFRAPGSAARRSRHAMVIHPGWFDRSPCGTGTSARMAQLHARGALAE